MRAILDSKLQGETRTYTFDFISQLAVGETISTKAVAATVYSGTDANPSAIVSGAAGSSGTKVTQSITGGVLGVLYTLICTITTSTGQTLQMSGFVAVVPNI